MTQITPSPDTSSTSARTAPTADQLRKLASDGMSRRHMAALFDLSVGKMNRTLAAHGITTCAPSGGAGQPIHDNPLVGGFGKQPAKLMPSARALSLVSVWGLAGHV